MALGTTARPPFLFSTHPNNSSNALRLATADSCRQNHSLLQSLVCQYGQFAGSWIKSLTCQWQGPCAPTCFLKMNSVNAFKTLWANTLVHVCHLPMHREGCSQRKTQAGVQTLLAHNHIRLMVCGQMGPCHACAGKPASGAYAANTMVP